MEIAIYKRLIANGVNTKIAADIAASMATDHNYRGWSEDAIVARATERRINGYNIHVCTDQATEWPEFWTGVYVEVRYNFTAVTAIRIDDLRYGELDHRKIAAAIHKFQAEWGDLPVDLGKFAGQVALCAVDWADRNWLGVTP